MEKEEKKKEEGDELSRVQKFCTLYSRPDYTGSSWGLMLGREEDLRNSTTREALRFRTSYRVLFPFLEELVKEVASQGWLGRGIADASGRPSIALQLKICRAQVLAVLLILSRGTYFDDAMQLSFMPENTVVLSVPLTSHMCGGTWRPSVTVSTKEGHAIIAYEVTIEHTQRAVAVTAGFS
ncbi:unnamed protein product [Discosporangium mesarthrocarpum]